MNYQEPSPQTVKAIGECRGEFAQTCGVCRNAIDQLMAGNTRDPYLPFREWFKDVCATTEADADAYLIDLQTIKQKFRPVMRKGVCEAFLDNLGKAHKFIEAGTRALSDGELDRAECLDLMSKIHKTEEAFEELKHAVIDQKNLLSGAILPDEVREKARLRKVS